jgi:hypothetical protein
MISFIKRKYYKMCCNIYSRVITGTISVLILLIPCILFNSGVGREWNKNAVGTKCFIIDYIIVENECPYNCDCKTVCEIVPDGDGGKVTKCFTECDTCLKVCYNGNVVVYINNIEKEVFALTDDTVDSVNLQLNNKYPLNGTVTCYYNKNIVKFSNEENPVYFGFYIFFTIVAGLVALITLSVELYLYYKTK